MQISSPDFNGIISLFIFCMEIVFLLNILLFAQKNSVNKTAMLIVLLLAVYQFYEFLICYFGIDSHLIVYLAFLVITLLPPLALLLGLKLYGNVNKKLTAVIFIPALFFIFFYAAMIEKMIVAECTVLYAVYHYPLGNLYGFFYYFPIYLGMFFQYLAYAQLAESSGHRSDKKETDSAKRKLILLVFVSFVITFVPACLVFAAFPSTAFAIESILCKISFIVSIALTYFALKFKTT